MRFADFAIIFATLMGPVFAVQVQKWVERRGAKKGAQEKIFYTLMATRGVPTSPGHVEALNAIPIVFYERGVARTSKDGIALESINQHWRRLLHHFNVDQANFTQEQGRQWERERRAYEVVLLKDMGDYLGFNFPELDIENQHYFPVGQGNLLDEQEIIRKGLATVLSGRAGFPIYVTGIAQQPQANQANPAPAEPAQPANDAPAQPARPAAPEGGNQPAA